MGPLATAGIFLLLLPHHFVTAVLFEVVVKAGLDIAVAAAACVDRGIEW